jgi:basic amino acid/polyamine antiporter, APA family
MPTQVKNPGVDMPVGIVGCISFVSILYTSLALVLVLMVPYTEIDTAASFSTAFTQVGYNWGQVRGVHRPDCMFHH